MNDKSDERLNWAMYNMHRPETSKEFMMHVLRVGGIGDMDDIITFIDKKLADEK